MKIFGGPYILILTSLALASCAGSSKTMKGVMSSWVGSDLQQVIKQWGAPSEEKVIDGKKIFIWYYEKEATIPQRSLVTNGSIDPQIGSFQSVTTTSIITTLHGYCTRILEVDKNNVVQSWRWNGNNCPFAEWMEYKKWRNKSPSSPDSEVSDG